MKKNIDLARAWRDEDYYLSLTEEERSGLGNHPAGAMSLQDVALKSIAGGCVNTNCDSIKYCTAMCTPCPPVHCY